MFVLEGAPVSAFCAPTRSQARGGIAERPAEKSAPRSPTGQMQMLARTNANSREGK